MRRSLGAIVILAMSVLGLPATAWAGKAATPAVTITSVVPGAHSALLHDDCGYFYLYDAHVTVTWSGTHRLDVYYVESGLRRAPGEITLSGSGSRTVVVPGVVVLPGTSGYLQAIASKLVKRSWTPVATANSVWFTAPTS